jgi:ribosomal protein S15P/S13E
MLHLEKCRHDHKTTRSLIQRLSKRRKALNWLKMKDYHMYRWIIKDYGIEDIKYANHKEYFHFKAKRNPI